MLKSTPKAYKLPPKEEDQAVKRAETNKKTNDFMESLGLGKAPLTRKDLEQLQKGRQPLKPHSTTYKSSGGIDPLMLNYTKPRMERVYKDLMNNTTSQGEIRYTTKDWDRAQGRDNWKDLNLPNQGVPQGTSFGPFLSSLAVSVYFKEARLKNWIMYIDDGLIFHNSPIELRERLARLQKALNKMSVELAPEKSKLHTTTTLLTESIKFLGVRIKNLPHSVYKRSFFTMASDTRKGTRKSIPSITSAQMLSVLEEMLKNGLITISKYRYAKWAVAQSKAKQVFEGDVVALSIKYGFFGYLLSWLYNPETDMETMKTKINQGIKLATETILKQERSIGSMILKEAQWEYLDVNGVVRSIKPDLNNHSTLCVELLLESLQQGIVSLRAKKRLVSKGTQRVTYAKPVSGWWSKQQIDNHKQLTHLILRKAQLELRIAILEGNLKK